ncbi:MAG: GIN domain-containing protein [Bacteroidota bacterium]
MKTNFKFQTLVFISIFLWTSCSKSPSPSPNPQNPSPTAQPFHNIVTSGLCKVNLISGAINNLDTVKGSIVTSLVNGTLFISGAGEATISIIDLDSLIANGSSEILAPSSLNLDHIVIVGNGLSKMNLNMAASDSIIVVSNGAGPYTFSGNTSKLHLYANGLASFRGYNLITKDCIVGLLGVGNSEVYASNSLTAYIAGMGVIYYKGNPPTVNKVFIAGLGKLVKK